MKANIIDETGTVDNPIQLALNAVHGITLLRKVLQDTVGQHMLAFLHELTEDEISESRLARAYGEVFYALATAANTEESVTGLSDAWQAHLVARIIDDINPWSIQAEQAGKAHISPTIRAQAQRDLRSLRLLFDLTAETLWQLTHDIVTPSLPGLDDSWVPWRNLAPTRQEQRMLTARYTLCHTMSTTKDWSSLVDPLTEHWACHGTGLFARYHILRWQGRSEGLQGIAHPDPIQFDSLIGYEPEQAILKRNTERFLQGLPAHDTILYGPPGTGKSSTVKALANTYADQGLCLIELRKDLVNNLPTIVAQLRGHAPRFLIFIDDLSFEEHETEYKALKVLLEGAAEARPGNVLIYATTNRLNIIRENFSDRGKPTDDVHWRDTMDEKNSLVARFGLRVTFATPNQERYLEIVTKLAQQRQLDVSEEALHERALTWERQHTGRSGRIARQFIDDLEAELKQVPETS